jgi:uncharacterized protein DUF1360
MTALQEMKNRLIGAARVEEGRYEGGQERPLRGYVLTMATYTGLVGAIAAAARATRRSVPAGLGVTDVALCAAATHKLSRLLTKDPVTSPLRAPFTTYQGTAGPAELQEEVRGSGTQHAVGELVTCPFCAEVWVATGLIAGLVFLPRTTRLVIGGFASLAGADLLQFAHAWMEKVSG